MDNYDKPTPWRARQARWSIPDLTLAIKLHCQACNQEERFLDSNDCVSPSCALYPFRPGTARPEVAGIRRAVKRAQTGGRKFTATRDHGATKPAGQPTGRESIPSAGGAL